MSYDRDEIETPQELALEKYLEAGAKEESMTEAKEKKMKNGWQQKRADGAGRYGSFAEFQTQVVMADRDMYGWVDDRFYHLYPGGRCIDYTGSVKEPT